MDFPPPEANHSSINLNDILFAIFKHKGKVLLCAIAGIAAAAIVYLNYPAVYESGAKLLVRYVVDRSAIDPVDGPAASNALGKTTENEAAILTSWDLAVQVADAIGPKRLLPEQGDAATNMAAAATVSSGVEVNASRGSDIIYVSYKNKDPQLATLVLDELVNRYFNKHLEVHRSAAAFDFVTQQSDQVKARLNETEEALKALKAKAGVTSVADNTATLNADVVKIEDQYLAAQTELAEQTARVKEIEQSLGAGSSESAASSSAGQNSAKKKAGSASADSPVYEPTYEEIQQYQALMSRLTQLRQARLDLLSRYTPENQLVKLNQAEITNLEHQRHDLEKKFPSVSAQVASGSGQTSPLDIGSERARLAGTKARMETLKSRLDERIKQLSDVGAQIAALERKKELEETNYKYFQGAVEKARVDEALDPSKMPNISIVQRPSPPIRVLGKRDKIVLGLTGAGTALGLALALLSELVLNRTVKRPLDLEKQLHIPLMVSIPYRAHNGRLRLPSKESTPSSAPLAKRSKRGNLAPWESDHFIRRYCEAIRDRLGLFFELNQLTHKPKLVGVTSFSKSAGTSTLAAGLAASLSETDDGKVLLVDVNLGPEDVHPFFRGRPAYSLNAALKPSGSIDAAAENLYLATVGPQNSGGPAQLGLKKFFDLMPNLKASDFDYIIFDMPHLSQTSPTWGMAAFMDKVLLVVEADKNNREAVKRGYTKLVAERDNVSVVFNKARSYVPGWLDGES
jgi:uncharacterized protein involved in exopolysaccharide biosynthesis/Mrp family chromosome partitioning ATPase